MSKGYVHYHKMGDLKLSGAHYLLYIGSISHLTAVTLTADNIKYSDILLFASSV